MPMNVKDVFEVQLVISCYQYLLYTKGPLMYLLFKCENEAAPKAICHSLCKMILFNIHFTVIFSTIKSVLLVREEVINL